MGKDIYVIGHRSPDTDSICSAIAFVLAHFGVPVPELLKAEGAHNRAREGRGDPAR